MLIWSAAAPVVCTALAPWMATAQIVLRSAIFLIRKVKLPSVSKSQRKKLKKRLDVHAKKWAGAATAA